MNARALMILLATQPIGPRPAAGISAVRRRAGWHFSRSCWSRPRSPCGRRPRSPPASASSFRRPRRAPPDADGPPGQRDDPDRRSPVSVLVQPRRAARVGRNDVPARSAQGRRWRPAREADRRLAQREIADASGHFSMPVGFTPWAPGRSSCAATSTTGRPCTLASASLTLDVSGRRPVNVSKPRVKRSQAGWCAGRAAGRTDPTSLTHAGACGAPGSVASSRRRTRRAPPRRPAVRSARHAHHVIGCRRRTQDAKRCRQVPSQNSKLSTRRYARTVGAGSNRARPRPGWCPVKAPRMRT